jgi:Squalene-hopene cyclase C-terminal domain
LRALQVYGPKTHRSKYDESVKRAADWLVKVKPQTSEERAYQLLGLSWAGFKSDNPIVRHIVRDLVAEQRSDGGWASLHSLASNAYSTGLALVALKQAGAVEPRNASFKQGVAFLLKTQLADGSWYVKSRAVPFQPYFESGFPHGHDQWISAAATNWATTALALAAGSKKQ